MSQYWQFIKLKSGDWLWEIRDPNGIAYGVGPFRTFDDCVQDAKENGFEQKNRDRRKDRRQ